jgi:hypothetical protein
MCRNAFPPRFCARYVFAAMRFTLPHMRDGDNNIFFFDQIFDFEIFRIAFEIRSSVRHCICFFISVSSS